MRDGQDGTRSDRMVESIKARIKGNEMILDAESDVNQIRNGMGRNSKRCDGAKKGQTDQNDMGQPGGTERNKTGGTERNGMRLWLNGT